MYIYTHTQTVPGLWTSFVSKSFQKKNLYVSRNSWTQLAINISYIVYIVYLSMYQREYYTKKQQQLKNRCWRPMFWCALQSSAPLLLQTIDCNLNFYYNTLYGESTKTFYTFSSPAQMSYFVVHLQIFLTVAHTVIALLIVLAVLCDLKNIIYPSPSPYTFVSD